MSSRSDDGQHDRQRVALCASQRSEETSPSHPIFSGHDHIVRNILTHAAHAGLYPCLSVSRQFHDIASEIIYRSINLFETNCGEGDPIDKVLLGWDNGGVEQIADSKTEISVALAAKAGLPNFKARQLSHVRHMTLGLHPSDVCATLPLAGPLFTRLETLTIIPTPHDLADSAPMMCKTAQYRDDVYAHRRRPCPFITALNPRVVVFRNLGYSGLCIPHDAGWNPDKLEKVAFYLPPDRRIFEPEGDVAKSPLIQDLAASFPGRALDITIVFAEESISAWSDESPEDLDRFLNAAVDEFGTTNPFYDLPPGLSMDWSEPMSKDEVVDFMRAIVPGVLIGCRSLRVIGMEWLPIETEDGRDRCIDDDGLWKEIRMDISKDLDRESKSKLSFVPMELYAGEAPQWEMTEEEKVQFDSMLECERKAAMDAAEEWGSDMSDDFDDDSDLFGAYENIDDDYELYFDYGNEFGYGHEDDDDEDDGYD